MIRRSSAASSTTVSRSISGRCSKTICRTWHAQLRRPERLCRTNAVRVRFLLLLFAAPLFAADVPLAMPPIGPAPYRRDAVFTASNGHGFLVVSAEQRNRQAIFGMLTDPQGLPLAQSMFVIHQSPLGDRLLAVASNGDTYLVAYETDVTNGHSVRVARVDDHGGIVARDAGFAHLDDVSMVWSGSAYVV